jgi:hypothetical protein
MPVAFPRQDRELPSGHVHASLSLSLWHVVKEGASSRDDHELGGYSLTLAVLYITAMYQRRKQGEEVGSRTIISNMLRTVVEKDATSRPSMQESTE